MLTRRHLTPTHRTRLRPRQAPQGGPPPPAGPARPPPRDVQRPRVGAPLRREPGRHGRAPGDRRRRPALRLLRQDRRRHAVGARRPAQGAPREGEARFGGGRPQREGARAGAAQVPGQGGRGPAVQRRGAGGECGLGANRTRLVCWVSSSPCFFLRSFPIYLERRLAGLVSSRRAGPKIVAAGLSSFDVQGGCLSISINEGAEMGGYACGAGGTCRSR